MGVIDSSCRTQFPRDTQHITTLTTSFQPIVEYNNYSKCEMCQHMVYIVIY